MFLFSILEEFLNGYASSENGHCRDVLMRQEAKVFKVHPNSIHLIGNTQKTVDFAKEEAIVS